jgi:hypothetical protein
MWSTGSLLPAYINAGAMNSAVTHEMINER